MPVSKRGSQDFTGAVQNTKSSGLFVESIDNNGQFIAVASSPVTLENPPQNKNKKQYKINLGNT